jgi:phosphoesterase RecJ-like protein
LSPSLDTAYRAVAATLESARRILICGHVDPDGDSVGSTLGLFLALRGAGKQVTPVIAGDSTIPPAYEWLPGTASLMRTADVPALGDLFVALDTPVLDRLGDAADLAKASDRVLVIDHHPDPHDFGDTTLVDTSAAAVGSMAWRLLQLMGITPSSEVATCLYTALLTDTGRFQYDNTRSRTLRIAADMIDHGVDVTDTSRAVYESKSAPALAMIGRTLARITVAGADEAETEQLVDEIRALGGISAAFLIRVKDGECRVSLRAKEDADVGAVARELGGGGHRAAAGATVAAGFEDTIARLLPLLPGGGR